MKTIDFIAGCPVFANNAPSVLEEISGKMQEERFAAGAVIIKEGDEGDKFYVVREGLVEVSRKPDPVAKRQRPVLAELGSGSFFGETALMTGRPRNATVTAKADTVTCTLKKADFLAVLRASPSFKNQLHSAFSTRQSPEHD